MRMVAPTTAMRVGRAVGATLAAEPGVTEAGEGHGAEEAERSLRQAWGRGSRAEPAASA
jgi:hypothetical protein